MSYKSKYFENSQFIYFLMMELVAVSVGWNGYSVPYYLYGGFETSLTIMVVLFVPAASPFTVDKGKKVVSLLKILTCKIK